MVCSKHPAMAQNCMRCAAIKSSQLSISKRHRGDAHRRRKLKCPIVGSGLAISPGQTMRCCTPAMVRPKGTAMSQNRMRCAAIERQTCSIFWYRFWNISAIYHPIFKRFQHCDGDSISCHVISNPTFSVK